LFLAVKRGAINTKRDYPHAVNHNMERKEERRKTNVCSGHGFLTSCERQSVARSHLSAQLGALSLRGSADKQPLRDIACELGAPRENLFFRIIAVARIYSLSTFSSIF